MLDVREWKINHPGVNFDSEKDYKLDGLKFLKKSLQKWQINKKVNTFRRSFTGNKMLQIQGRWNGRRAFRFHYRLCNRLCLKFETSLLGPRKAQADIRLLNGRLKKLDLSVFSIVKCQLVIIPDEPVEAL